jgi:hypothetical protein
LGKVSSKDQEISTSSEISSPLTAAAIQRVKEGVAAASDRAVRQMIADTLSQLESIQSQNSPARSDAGIRRLVLGSLIHWVFQVK